MSTDDHVTAILKLADFAANSASGIDAEQYADAALAAREAAGVMADISDLDSQAKVKTLIIKAGNAQEEGVDRPNSTTALCYAHAARSIAHTLYTFPPATPAK